jgi:hypothetical protein
LTEELILTALPWGTTNTVFYFLGIRTIAATFGGGGMIKPIREAKELLVKHAALFVLSVSFLVCSCVAQTLDQQAWNEVNNRLAAYIPAGGVYKVHFPPQSLYALWHDQNSLDGIANLNLIAGTMPPWNPGWQSGGDSLPVNYGWVIDGLDYPPAVGVTGAKKKKILADYDKSVKDLYAAVDGLQDKLVKEIKRQKDLGFDFKAQQQQVWWSHHANELTSAIDNYDDAVKEYEATIDPNWSLHDAAEAFRNARKGATTKQGNSYPYDGSAASLATLIANGKAAETSNQCTTGWEFNKATHSQDTSSSSWGASGSYGPFISLGANSSSFSDDVADDGTHVSIKFCSIAYIPIAPVDWYRPDVLKLVKDGNVKIRPDSLVAHKVLFGENGWLTRQTVGVIAAYRPMITAKLTTATSHTFEQKWSGSGGIGIGPLKIGGNAGGSRREVKTTNADGSFTITGVGEEPYIIAIISREIP